MTDSSLILEAEVRSENGSRNSRRLRKAGRIPAVVYKKNESVAITVDEIKFRPFINSSQIITVNLGSDSKDVLIQETQWDYLKNIILHIDFKEVEKGVKLKATAKIALEGNLADGLVLSQSLSEVEIECLPKDLPEDIKIDISTLEAGQSISVSDLSLPNGVEAVTGAEAVVLSVEGEAAEEEATEAAEESTEEGAEPAE